MHNQYHKLRVIDSHTGGEPTRAVIDSIPDLGDGSLQEQANCFSSNYDSIRSLIVNEPRGSDILVGALLLTSTREDCIAGVIFFNNVGILGMCGHGMIGVIRTLQYLNRIQPGVHRIETTVGIVQAVLHDDGKVSIRNVPSFRAMKDYTVHAPGYGTYVGDIVWGGNWFYLIENHQEELKLNNVAHLTELTWRIRQAIPANLVNGIVDHIELFSAPLYPENHSRNFVLCPGKAYDRSPCGTGTSAKLACLAVDGKLRPGEIWRQESITGTVFEGTYEMADDNTIIPTITGSAFITSDTTLLFDRDDPLSSTAFQ